MQGVVVPLTIGSKGHGVPPAPAQSAQHGLQQGRMHFYQHWRPGWAAPADLIPLLQPGLHLEPRNLCTFVRRLRVHPAGKPTRAGPRDPAQRRRSSEHAAAIGGGPVPYPCLLSVGAAARVGLLSRQAHTRTHAQHDTPDSPPAFRFLLLDLIASVLPGWSL